jgi:hypothetical protein
MKILVVDDMVAMTAEAQQSNLVETVQTTRRIENDPDETAGCRRHPGSIRV